MKEIQNIQFDVKVGGKPATTADLLKIALNRTPPQGFDFATIRTRIRISDACEAAESEGVIKLEDADFSAAHKCVEEYRWMSVHKDLLKFAEQFGL